MSIAFNTIERARLVEGGSAQFKIRLNSTTKSNIYSV